MPDESIPIDNYGKLKPSGEWRRKFDIDAWGAECKKVEKEIREASNQKEDFEHLQKIIWWSNVCWGLGVALAPYSIVAGGVSLSTAICARWTMVGHHVMHGGYSHNTDKNGRFHRFNFAKGFKKRMEDWLDWMLPEAWNVEHNKLHHYQLGEDSDPDLVERNMEPIRQIRQLGVPSLFLYPIVLFFALTWKWFYYMPNTLKEYEKSQLDNKGKKNQKSKWGHLGD